MGTTYRECDECKKWYEAEEMDKFVYRDYDPTFSKSVLCPSCSLKKRMDENGR
jgi:hypothetical protein